MYYSSISKSAAVFFCISLLVSVASARDTIADKAPFTISEFVERVLRRPRPISDGTSLVERWMQGPSTSLLEEFIIDTSITYVGAPYEQIHNSVAFDGTSYMVVWEDARSLKYDIYGARVDTSGSVLDPAGLAISSFVKLYPSVGFDGNNYLVVWEDWWRGYPDIDIYGARLDPSGAVLDSTGIPISTTRGEQRHPSIAFDGKNYLVVWEDYRSGTDPDIYGARVDTSGVVLDPSGRTICTADEDQVFPRLAFNGTDYLLVWEDFRNRATTARDIYGARVDTSGAVLDPSGIAISTANVWEWGPYVASGETDWLAVWADNRGGAGNRIYGARVDTSGTVLDTSPINISPDTGMQLFPFVAFDGTNYFVAWQDQRSSTDIYGARVDASGAVLDPSGIAISTAPEYEHYPSVAFDGTGYLVVWVRGRSLLDYDIYGARVDTSGTVRDSSGIPISTAAHPQWSPSTAFDGASYFVVWEDLRGGTDRDIYGARVTDSGTVLEPSGIAISTAGNDQYCPSVAFGGTNYLVVWDDYRNGTDDDIYGARLDVSGLVLDPTGIAICTAPNDQYSPSVAFDGTNYLVAWQDNRSGADIYGARVDTSGAVLNPSGIAICTASDGQHSPCVASDGAGYLVTWYDYRSGADCDIYGARVDTSGAVLDPSGIAICKLPDGQHSPHAVFDGTNYLVVWLDCRRGTYRISGARVSKSGTVLDSAGITICAAPYWAWNPQIAFDGTNYVVVWEDYRSLPWESDIYGARLDTSGVVLDPSGVELVNKSYSRLNPSIASGSNGQLLLVYDGFALEPYNSSRVFGAFYTDVGIEERSSSKVQGSRVELRQNAPNPFHARTTISYSLPASRVVTIRVYDSSGRLASVLADEQEAAGRHTVTWDGRDGSGRQLPSGIYFYRLQGGEFSATRKMVLVR